jgi:hypothetical protein
VSFNGDGIGATDRKKGKTKEGKTKDGKTKKSPLENHAEEESLLIPPLKTLQLEPAWLNLADIVQAGP